MLELSLTIASSVLLIAYLIFAFITYRKKEGEDFDIRNHFPFELWLKRTDPNFVLNIFLFIPFVLVTANFVLFAVNFYDVPTLVVAMMVVVISFCAVSLFIIPLSKFKEHCILAILMMTFSVMVNGFLIYKEIRLWGLDNNYLLLLPMIINAICGAFGLVMMFHPALFKFDMQKDSYGNLTRPKNFVICISEWGLMIALFLSQISIVVIRWIS